MSLKYYVVYSAKISLEADSAHEIHDVMCANAVANLDRSTVLAYPDWRQRSSNFSNFFHPFNCREPEQRSERAHV